VFCAPPLNEELCGHLDKTTLARDKHLLSAQTSLGAGLLAMGQAFSAVIADNESLDRKFVLQSLQEAGKILSKCTSCASRWSDTLQHAPLTLLWLQRTFSFNLHVRDEH